MSDALILVADSSDSTIRTFAYSDGCLTPLASCAAAPGLPLAVDAARSLVYAGTKRPSILTLHLDEVTGVLTPVAETPALGAPTSLALTSDGTRLLSACYHEGLGQVWQIGGGLTSACDPVIFSHLHCVVTSADDRFAYFVSLGDDLVAQFALGESGSLTPLDSPIVWLPSGVGARHLTLAPDGRNGYLITEYTAQVFRFTRDQAGVLSAAGSMIAHPGNRGLGTSRFGADPRAEHLIWGSDVRVTADGNLLYAAERNAATITAIRLNADGSLGDPTAHSEVVAQPRFFRTLADGRVLVASEIGQQLALYDADERGALTLVQAVPVGLGANWISIIER